MARRGWPGLLFAVLLWHSSAWGQAPAKKIQAPPLGELLPLLDAKSPQALAGVLRGAILKFMPDPLYESNQNWGNQRPAANQLKWEGDGILLKPKIYKTLKNDGNWKKFRLTGNNMADTLILDVRDLQKPQPDRMTFDLFLSFDARLEYDHQIWDRGTRLYGSTMRVRFRVKLLVKCEATVKLDSTKGLLPDAIFRLHATGANLAYDNLVFEHVAGIGGSGAKVLGKTFYNLVRDVNPSLESRLLEKASNAIVKAADSKEVRVSFNRMFGNLGNLGNLLPGGK